MKFFHVYNEECFKGLEKNGLLNKDTGFKIQQSRNVPKERQFNTIAAKGGALHSLVKNNNIPFYIDRFGGGAPFYYTKFDKELISEYKNLLGDWFLGFQYHESASNVIGHDWANLVKHMGSKGPYDVNEIRKKAICPYFPKNAYGEVIYNIAMATPEFYASKTMPENREEFLKQIAELFKWVMDSTDNNVLPCDSYFLATKYQNDLGMRTFMPEIGCQIPRTRIAVALARGIARMSGKTWGTYYECWRPRPGQGATMPCFNDDPINEWYAAQSSAVDDFTSCGENGGSSRLLQNRLYYYSLMSGAHYMGEEWGLNCSYTDMKDFTLSTYGEVKKDFINTALNYRGMDAKIPFAIVLPTDYAFVEIAGTLLDLKGQDRQIGEHRDQYLELDITDTEKAYFGHIEDVLKLFFGRYKDIYGNEGHVMTNSRFGDVVDILYEDAPEEAFARYEYLIDATKEGKFAKAKANSGLKILTSEDFDKLHHTMKELTKEYMPCYVDDLHWLVSTDENGQNYLSIFNNEGNERSLEAGDTIDTKADKCVTVTFKNEVNLDLVKSSLGSATVIGGRKVEIAKVDDKTYSVMIPATGFAIFKF